MLAEKCTDGKNKIGLVLSGGSGKVFFHVGALDFLVESDIASHISYIAAVSAGAVVAAKYLEGGIRQLKAAAMSSFKKPPFHLNKAGMAKHPFGGFKSFLSNEPLRKLIREINMEPVLKSSVQLDVITVNFLTGEEIVFSNYADRNALVIKEKADFVRAIMSSNKKRLSLIVNKNVFAETIIASTSLPGIFEPVEIYGIPIIDGGMVNPLPINHAINNGCNIIIVIDSDPCDEPLTLEQYHEMNWSRILTRGFHFPSKTIGQIQIERTKRINNKIKTISALYENLPKMVGENFVDSAKALFTDIFEQFNFNPSGRMVDPVIIRPDSPTLISSSMEWSIKDVKELMSQGSKIAERESRAAGLIV
ncbi:MAG: patatin-like phospholipase family protein [Patescibacteria group bacterium]